jgi:hypothetical protein
MFRRHLGDDFPGMPIHDFENGPFGIPVKGELKFPALAEKLSPVECLNRLDDLALLGPALG